MSIVWGQWLNHSCCLVMCHLAVEFGVCPKLTAPAEVYKINV